MPIRPENKARYRRSVLSATSTLTRYLPQPASIVAINVLPAAILFGPPSSTSAEASAVRGPSERRQIGSLAGPLTQPLTISISIAARYIRMVDPFVRLFIGLQALQFRALAAISLRSGPYRQIGDKRPQKSGYEQEDGHCAASIAAFRLGNSPKYLRRTLRHSFHLRPVTLRSAYQAPSVVSADHEVGRCHVIDAPVGEDRTPMVA